VARKKQKLPFIAGCLAFFLLMFSLFGITLGILYFMILGGSTPSALPEDLLNYARGQGRAELYLAVATSLVGVPTAIGLFAKRFWAYSIYTVLNGFAIGLGSVHLFLWHDWYAIPRLTINVAILVYMFVPGVRKVFA
jgi:hypothetical protein